MNSLTYKIALQLFISLVFLSAVKGASTVSVGVSKVDVTPDMPVLLAGYGGRTTEHEGIDTSLWARAMVIGDKNPVAIVVLDNCGISQIVTDRLAERLAKHGLNADQLVVAATHTHNAPTLIGYAPIVWKGRTTKEQDDRVQSYTRFVIEKMTQAVVGALAKREPMSLEWALGRATFGGNRRVISSGSWSGFGFQRNAPVDHSLPVLFAKDSKGDVRAVWANYACHCTTVGSRNRIGGDWAGYANTWIENEFGKAVSLMTIGCGADIGPQPSGTLAIAENHGKAIAEEAKRLFAQKTIKLTQVPSVITRRISLPLIKPKPRDYWEEQLKSGGFNHQLAKAMLARLDVAGEISDEVNYPLSVWKFGSELAVVFLAGEVVVDYSVRLKRELDWSRLWINGWANDMPGYIPSRRILLEGGYEADFSQVYYEQPGRYDPSVEDKLVNAVKEMVGLEFRPKPDQEPAPFHKSPSGESSTLSRLSNWVADSRSKDEKYLIQKLRQLVKFAQPSVANIKSDTHEETEWHNFAGDFVQRSFIRQQTLDMELKWDTPIVPGQNASTNIYVFTGGLGWQTEPETRGFLLSVQDEEKIEFDVTKKLSHWISKDGTVEMIYLPTWESGVDSGGFFFVSLISIPDNHQGFIEFSVRSLGNGSRRWFALDTKEPSLNQIRKLAQALD
ncbi:MAG: neutral/alkaline non-lysosomal ceramidase N-terminal domain-containing protein [Verrucomicrobiota bacterium]|nr:neutral/alkaline non-lysosomal ceramidase N-terminal domain-containing protein [Verrucomicrobiota bacterium]